MHYLAPGCTKTYDRQYSMHWLTYADWRALTDMR